MCCIVLQEFLDREAPKLAEGFSEPMPSMLRKTAASSLTALPAMDKPPHPVHEHGVVYIGDAWHPMSPFAGPGLTRMATASRLSAFLAHLMYHAVNHAMNGLASVYLHFGRVGYHLNKQLFSAA